MDGLAIANVGTLELRGVSKSYAVENRTLPVLSDIDLTIRPGEFVTIVGSSGCGKSTLLRLIVGLETDYEGEILLAGSRIAGPGLERGIVFQEHRLFPWLNVAQNVGLGLEGSVLPKQERRRAVQAHIELVRLSGFEASYPHQLSGGMAQRVAIARALVARPEILLLDEPLGALDSLTRAYLQDELLRIWREQRITMVMVTHDVEEALYLGTKVIAMEARPGRIRAVIAIDQPHPRDRAGAEFAALKQRILTELRA
jgi:sulfonate transport system ATP-binding protein